MKAAFSIFRYFPYGGVQRDLAATAQALQTHGFAITIFCDRASGDAPEGCRLVELPVRGWSNHARARSFERLFREATDREAFDVKVGFNRMSGLDLYFAGDDCLARRWRHKAFLRHFIPRIGVFLALEKAVMEPDGAPVILTLTARQEADYERFYHTDPARFRRLGPGVNWRFYGLDRSPEHRAAIRAGLGIGPDELLLVQVASSFRTKGVDRVLALVDRYRNTWGAKFRYLVAGGDPQLERDRARAAGRRLPVVFLGFTAEVPELLLAADLMVHPARDEATGGALAEALCAGLPVLTTELCGYADLVRDSGGGVVLPEPYCEETWREALAELLDGTGKLRELRRAIADYYRDQTLYNRPRRIAEIIAEYARRKTGERP